MNNTGNSMGNLQSLKHSNGFVLNDNAIIQLKRKLICEARHVLVNYKM